MARGVSIPVPHSVEIGEDVDIERISDDGVVLHSGTKLFGEKTLISQGCKLGEEAPATIDNCLLGRDVELKGGYFKESVFLDGANMACGAQVREACLLEEEANGSHTVGLKQTILFPFVTLGSLINFCDCFMAGGTNRKDHSEVGSSYIHFNYTPNQDKATASLIGDVPKGVMLRERPVFLGGQGGLVGPARIGYGAVIAAGTVFRKDLPEGGMLVKGADAPGEITPVHFGFYGDVARRIENNIVYIGNLFALRQWYRAVRQPFFDRDEEFGRALYAGVLDVLEKALKERIKRFEALAEKMPRSIEIAERILEGGEKKDGLIRRKKAFQEGWPRLKELFSKYPVENVAPEQRDAFLAALHNTMGKHYIEAIKSLSEKEASEGTAWLQAIVDGLVSKARQGHFPV